MRYLLKTEGTEYELSRRPVPKTDERGVQKVDRSGVPLWTVEVTAFTNEDEGSAVLPVTLASPTMPDLRWREPVDVIDLEMVPWASKSPRDGELRQGVVWKAAAIRPLNRPVDEPVGR